MKCAICENSSENKSYLVKEMMFGMAEEFEYFQCAQCETLQILSIPKDIEKYYTINYNKVVYSITKNTDSIRLRVENKLKASVISHRIHKKSIIGALLSLRKKYENYLYWVERPYFSKEKKILDVGCGTGSYLKELNTHGFQSLLGVDPYNAEEICIGNNLRILNSSLDKVVGVFDVIMMHHSFEHMPNPASVLTKLKSLLSENGVIIMRIPNVDSAAWREYGANWFQIDAPRHFFIYSPKGISKLSNDAGLYIEKSICDSNYTQFLISEKYKKGFAMNSKDIKFSNTEIKEYKSRAEQLNKEKQGDSICYFLKKQ